MADDISKKTVAVLLVVAIIISIVGTWVVLNARPSIRIEGGKPGASGQMFLGIEEQPPGPSSQSGVVQMGIEES